MASAASESLQERVSPDAASPAERKRLETVCESVPRRAKSRWSLDPVIRNLGVHFLFGQSRVIWEYCTETSKLDILSKRLGSLEDVWWMKIPLQENSPKYTMGFDAFRRMFLKRREERRKITISEELRRLEFAKKRAAIEREAFRHVLSRVISALSAHLFSSMVRSGGVHAFLQRIGLLRRRDTVLLVEDRRLVFRDEKELNEMLVKRDARSTTRRSADSSHSLGDDAACVRRRNAAVARIVLKMEILKLRLVLHLRRYELHVAEATKRRNDCIVSLVLNIVTMVFSHLDAQKVGDVVDVRQSISRLHPRIPRAVGKNVRVRWFRHVPTFIHACACLTNIYTAASSQLSIMDAYPEVQGLLAIDARLASAATRFIREKKSSDEEGNSNEQEIASEDHAIEVSNT